jgi:hypothetical protein
MKQVKFVHVRNVHTNEHFDIPQDFYEYKKKLLDVEFGQWESNEIPMLMQVRDDYRTISDMQADMYSAESFAVAPVAPVEPKAVVIKSADSTDRFMQLKTKGWANLNSDERTEYSAMKLKLETV